VDEDGYRLLSLDVAQASRSAVVLIAGQPIRWNVSGLAASSWPRLGFVGVAAFDVAGVPPGSLAGFRIGAFGAREVARALDPTRGEISIRQTLCASLQAWADLFGLPFEDVRFTLLLEPTRVATQDGLPRSDGEVSRSFFPAELDDLCKARGRRR
jgi:hypothetical protein